MAAAPSLSATCIASTPLRRSAKAAREISAVSGILYSSSGRSLLMVSPCGSSHVSASEHQRERRSTGKLGTIQSCILSNTDSHIHPPTNSHPARPVHTHPYHSLIRNTIPLILIASQPASHSSDNWPLITSRTHLASQRHNRLPEARTILPHLLASEQVDNGLCLADERC